MTTIAERGGWKAGLYNMVWYGTVRYFAKNRKRLWRDLEKINTLINRRNTNDIE